MSANEPPLVLASAARRPHFCTSLIVEELDDGTHQLAQWLVYYSVLLNGYLVLPAGRITNYANIPQAFFSLFPRDGPWKWAATLHDGGYRGELVTLMGQPLHLIKELADLLFYEAMSIRPEISDTTRELMYRVVRRFGGRAYGGLGTAA